MGADRWGRHSCLPWAGKNACPTVPACHLELGELTVLVLCGDPFLQLPAICYPLPTIHHSLSAKPYQKHRRRTTAGWMPMP